MDIPPESSVCHASKGNNEVKSPLMSEYVARFTSYHDWTDYHIQQPYCLAKAGFFCRDADDALVECYHCGLLLNHWTPTDSPMVEHIRHRPDCGFVYCNYSQETRNYYGSEHNAQLTKAHDFMNIEGRPTFNQYLLWKNYMARLGVQLLEHKPSDLMKWRAAKQRDILLKGHIKTEGYETLERRLGTLLHSKSPVKDSATALKMAEDGLMFLSNNPHVIFCAYCGRHDRMSDDLIDKFPHNDPCWTTIFKRA